MYSPEELQSLCREAMKLPELSPADAASLLRRLQHAADEDRRYNGWKNYETWVVNLHLSNDQGTYNQWTDTARELCRDASELPQVIEGIWSERESAVIRLADLLKSNIGQDDKPDLGATLYADLLGAACDSVDWHEVAHAWLDDSPEYQALPDKPRKGRRRK